ncbi:hypothetical protein L0U85_05890 [Glycomyces sp. L485]|uniref:hypothetical protein n=1 Tax=Glycomyces sp. L485 TaxID=2909235 RepID=UPI001F4A7717|nr:hypothetical protein [Glycomyces sp. L485]MCH7230390.1 hypothetical protein [Glycomyces sp. L485]
MTKFYQAVLRDGGDGPGRRLRRCFADWASVDDDGAPHFERERGRTRVSLSDSEVCGRYTVDIPTGGGRLRTTATWAEGKRPDRNWVTVTVEGELAADAEPVRAPSLVTAFLRTGRVTDGAVPLEAAPHVAGRDEVDELTGWLAHPGRAVPVIVLTVDRAEPEIVAAHADRLAEALAGTAVVVRLFDIQAQDLLNRRLGEGLAVFGGGLRTYLPGLTPGAEAHSSRHPVRGGGAIRDQGARALEVVIDGVLDQALRRRLPADIRRADARIARILSGDARPEQLHAAPPSPAELARARNPQSPAPQPKPPEPAPLPPDRPGPPDDLADLAERVSGQVTDNLADGILDALVDMARGGDSETTRLIRTMSAHLNALTRAVEETDLLAERSHAADPRSREFERLRKDYNQLEFDYELLLDDERRARERIRWLESRLAQHADPVYGVDTPGEAWEADSLMEVVNRARETLERVDLPDTLDHEVAKLDVTYPRLCRRWTAKTWDALTALDAYAAARAEHHFTGGFYDWCGRPLPGRPAISPNMVSMKESDSVSGRPKFREARTFRVPTAIDPTGRIYMPSHIKLQRVGNPAPRMHFLDDAGGPTGKVWIGYLGDHLPNTKTN